MRAVGMDRHLPAQPAARFATERLQGYREQTRGNLFTSGDHHVIFGGIIQRVRLTTEVDEPVGITRHSGDNDGNFVTAFCLTLHQLRDTADTFRSGHRRAAKFHYNAGHENLEKSLYYNRGP